MNLDEFQRRLLDLERDGYDVSALRQQHTAREALRERAVPTEDDTRFPLVDPGTIEEHLGARPLAQKTVQSLEIRSEERLRPYFGCAIAEGRQYRLTLAQRQILREEFHMIPSPEVVVIRLETFPGATAPVVYARNVVIRTIEHVSNGTVVNSPRSVTISAFGKFMSACAAREKDLTQQREIARLTARVEKLLKRARAEGVAHGIASAGTVAYPWHSVIELKKLVDPDAVREELRVVLLSRGEHGLAKLVKEPFFRSDGDDKEEEYLNFVKALGLP